MTNCYRVPYIFGWSTLPAQYFSCQLTLFVLRLHYRSCDKEVLMPDM